MAQKNIYKVKIKVHPAVVRHFENTFTKKHGAYDLRKHFYYNLISSGLTRKTVKVPSMLSKRYEDMKEVEILITSWDYHHHGDIIPPVYQVALSQHIYKQILYDACTYTLFAHVYGLMARDTAIKQYLFEYLFDEEELNYPALRKHYQRHWLATEQALKDDLAQLCNKPSAK